MRSVGNARSSCGGIRHPSYRLLIERALLLGADSELNLPVPEELCSLLKEYRIRDSYTVQDYSEHSISSLQQRVCCAGSPLQFLARGTLGTWLCLTAS